MARPILISVVVLCLATRWTLCFDHYKQEAQTIMKRLAGEGRAFEGHDVAKVHIVDCQGQCKRRLSKRDLNALRLTAAEGEGTGILQLDLSMGSKVNLVLKPAGIVGPDTEVAYLTSNGRVERKLGVEDCYSHGHVEDSSGKGIAAISHCDGIFGFAASHHYEYFFHPVEGRRSKRESGEDHDVHVMWRRSKREIPNHPDGDFDDEGEEEEEEEEEYEENEEDPQNNFDNLYADDVPSSATGSTSRPQGSDSGQLNTTEMVIEMAMFSDAQYWERLEYLYPGRENDYLLVRLTGTQALYSDRDSIGYDVKIKLKLLEYWVTNPVGYNFTQTLSNNLHYACPLTTNSHSYDVHAINTGIVKWNQGRIGLSYVHGACRRNRCCLITKSVDLHSFVGFAHELGHSLGMVHYSAAKCPDKEKSGGGFMGGSPYRFSPCMKYQLDRFLDSGKGNCLFRESSNTNLSSEYTDIPSVFPGQSRTPDELCKLLAGPGYRFGPHERPYGDAVCKWFICLNEDKSPEYGSIRRFIAPTGFPCAKKSFCDRDKLCKKWTPGFAKHIESLQSGEPDPTWSEWSSEFSPCSRSCGTGIRTRRRECQIEGLSLTLQCMGMVVQPELCNTQPCQGEPTSISALRQIRGNEVCLRFLQHNVQLRLRGAVAYLAIAKPVTTKDVGPRLNYVHSQSCILKCQRNPVTVKGDLDAVMPDGTPCTNYKRPPYAVTRFNIDMRCVRGLCLEFSDCPEKQQKKDTCGVCGGDGSRCVELVYDSRYNVPRKQRASLTVIPAGSTNIDVSVFRKKNIGVVIELWSKDGQNIIGDGGQYPRNKDYEGVDFAGTKWSYHQNVAYLRAPGPLKEAVAIKAIRLLDPIQKINLSYAKSSSNDTST